MVNVDSWWDSLVRDRFRALLELVLDAIAEDYVTVEIILKNINEWNHERDPVDWKARDAVPVSPPEVVRALRELTREGYAQAFVFNGAEPQAVDFRDVGAGGLWFCATQKGLAAASKFETNS